MLKSILVFWYSLFLKIKKSWTKILHTSKYIDLSFSFLDQQGQKRKAVALLLHSVCNNLGVRKEEEIAPI